MRFGPKLIGVVVLAAVVISTVLYAVVSKRKHVKASTVLVKTPQTGLTPLTPIVPEVLSDPSTAAVPGRTEPIIPTTKTAPIVAAAPPVDNSFNDKVRPFLSKYCNGCHNSEKNAAGVSLDVYMNEAHARNDRKTWEIVTRVLTDGEMPPKKKPQPEPAEREAMLAWLANITKVDCTAAKNPGRVTVRRLNKAEYNNTVRDLCGVEFKPADDFPSDDVGYGFDNIGDVLSLQPLLIEKYMTAADRILEAVIIPLNPVMSGRQSFKAQNILTIPRDAKTRDPKARIVLTVEGAAYLERFNFPARGKYTIKIRAYGASPDDTKPRLVIRLDSKDLKTFDVEGTEDKPGEYSTTVMVEAGDHRVAATFPNPSEPKTVPAGKKPRSLGIGAIEIDGPIGGASKPLPAATKLVLGTVPHGDITRTEAAEKTLAEFARRAYRRPVKPAELTRLMKLFSQGDAEPFEQAIRLPLKAILVSPHFLFRVEDDPRAAEEIRTINDFELASRLSYFLWSTMPDDELYQLAETGELRKPGILDAQVRRMLASPKSVALTDNFAGQWLMLRNLRTLTPDNGLFPTWDDGLRAAMIRETELFFEYIVRNERKVTEFLDADYTFVNERLARHYGINGIFGSSFRKIQFADSRRGGIITMASVLTVTSNPTRTSPVKRGKWVLENLLGVQPPPPAPDVPELPPVGQLKGTLRQQMEQHRANPACANCHAKLDPLGFGLENFDGIGLWRDKDNKQAIDASGVLPDGNQFNGPAELRKVLLTKSDEFRRCLAEKLLTFALGRGLEYYDKCALDALVAGMKKNGDTIAALVSEIVHSDPFQKRQGKRSDKP